MLQAGDLAMLLSDDGSDSFTVAPWVMDCRPYKVRMADGLEGDGDPICITSLVPAEEDAAVRMCILFMLCVSCSIMNDNYIFIYCTL
jgi:hypothetical protein